MQGIQHGYSGVRRRGVLVVALLGALLAALAAAAPSPAQEQEYAWIGQKSGTFASLYDVSFVDASRGWVVGAGGGFVGGESRGPTILTTSDGGTSWTRQESGLTGGQLQAVSFVDANHGWAVGSARDGDRREAATILATSDGGATWSVQYTDPDARFSSLSGVSFVDRYHGWAVGSRYLEGADGSQAAILATSDGGRTWTPQQSGTSATGLNDVKFVDASHGWAVGAGTTSGGECRRPPCFTPSGAILATKDGGATWTPQESGTSTSLNGVDFLDSLHGTAVGGGGFGPEGGGVIVTTSDGGATWRPRSSGTSAGLNDVDLVTATRGYAVGGGFSREGPRGIVVASGDGGETWTVEESNTRESLNGVSFPDPGQPNIGYAVGESGAIQKRSTAPPRPVVTAVEPNSGSTVGPTSVTIRGTGFTGAVAVRSGGVNLPSYTVVSDTEITAETPTEQPTGTVHVTVTAPSGTSGARPEDSSAETAADLFTYVAPTGGEWRLTGSLATARLRHSATQLKDGRVLVVGGRTPPSDDGFFEEAEVLASAELYDPATGQWKSCSQADASASCPAPLAAARAGHTATLLSNGKVLVTGGTDNNPDRRNSVLASAELYDPATGKWSSAGSLAEPRGSVHTATLLSGPRCGSRCGMVLVTGGRNGASGGRSLATSQLYDPENNRWLAADDLEQGRNGHTAHMLPDGRVLVVSGYRGHDFEHSDPPDPEAQPELYDPQLDRWTFAERQEAPSHGNAATLLAGGKVLVAGGLNMVGRDTTCLSDLYDPADNDWSSPGSLQVCRYLHDVDRGGHTLTALPDGRAVMAGGDRCDGFCTTAAVELFDPKRPLGTSAWSLVASMNFARQGHTATLLSGPGCGPSCGKILVAGGGGYNSDFSKFTAPAAAELYTPPAEGTRGGGAPSGGAPSRGQPQGSTKAPVLSAFTGCPTLTANLIRGSASANTITGTMGADRIFAGTGSDTVDGLAGDDCIDLGAGNDSGQGGFGADLMLGGLGADRISGSSGNDRLRGNGDDDRIDAGRGNDRVFGDQGNDLIRASFGNDRLHGVSGNDRLFGSRGRDRINGGSGTDKISAGSSNDRIAGDAGNDRINGNSGNDVLKGNSGNDRIKGSTGADRIAGGSGGDRIDSRDGRRDRVNCGRGRDRVVADRFDVVARNCERVRRR